LKIDYVVAVQECNLECDFIYTEHYTWKMNTYNTIHRGTGMLLSHTVSHIFKRFVSIDLNLCFMELHLPGVWEEWVGGTFTNFREMAKRIKYFNDMEAKQASGELEKYTKKERHEFSKTYAKMRKKWEGLKALKKLPDVVILSNIYENALALKEARSMRIPVIAITDSNTDPLLADYPIPANDDAVTSLTFVLNKIKEAILSGRGIEATVAPSLLESK